ncbi:9750_t:CDS:2 [Dentiscutata erythropus]|uniref:9750_t:CDS:1 n=1 Tax=Dentiscutata erythropus TaxID=1348616 RepID=A0A9N9H299_9GLOM|nr:9750_t:CDS:2 [Dentiscutata erythropus]
MVASFSTINLLLSLGIGFLFVRLTFVIVINMKKKENKFRGRKNSEASDIELDTEHVITDNNNKVYCRCYLCAEEGYGGAWISKNT